MSAADLPAIAATTLRRLASDMRAASAIGAQRPAALVGDYNRACALLAETRREAVRALERLALSFPVATPDAERLEAITQARQIETGGAEPDDLDRWAVAWEALP